MKNNTSSIGASELMHMLHNKEDIFLLDVREKWEHDDFNIGGTLIPLASIFDDIDLIDKEKTVVVYCRKGIRSQIAIQRLQQRYGLKNLVNLTGGMEAWAKEVKIQSSDLNRTVE